MESENNKIIRGKLDGRAFEPSQAKWDAALLLIKRQEKKKKRRLLLYLFSVSALLLSSGYFHLNSEAFHQIKHNKVAKSKKPKLSTQMPFNAASTNIRNEVKKSDEQLTSHKLKQNEKKSENKAHEQPNKKNLSLKPKEIENHNIQQLPKTGKKSETNNYLHPHALKINDTSVVLNKAKYLSGDNSLNHINETNNNRSIVSDTMHETAFLEHEINRIVPLEPPVNKDTSTAMYQVKKSIAINADIKTDTGSIKPVASAMVLQIDTNLKKIDVFELYALIGVLYTPGFATNTSSLNGFNPMAGILITKLYKNNYGISVGCHYALYSCVYKQSKVYTSTFQEFGNTNYVTEINYNRMHYLKVPLIFSHHYQNNSFGFGCTFGYLLTGSSTLKTYHESYGVIKNAHSVKYYGYTNGFKPFDVSCILSYRRKLFRNTGIGITVEFGLTDVKNNSFFNSSTFERNNSIQLFLSQKLYK
jgi:hypothetical protein